MNKQGLGQKLSDIKLSMRRGLERLNGSTVNYDLRCYYSTIKRIRELEATYSSKTRGELRKLSQKLREKMSLSSVVNDNLVEAFALVSETIKREFGFNVHDEQLIAAIVLNDGNLAEMQTGEGKTLAAVFPAYLNALTGQGVCILTFNDYLAKRDAQWMGPVYEYLGVSVAYVQEGMGRDQRKRAYYEDVTYLTAREFGFDYLRDGLCYDAKDQVRRECFFAIVDEADSILIDEARVPLILAASNDEIHTAQVLAKNTIRKLDMKTHVALDEYSRNIMLTESGLDFVENDLKIESLYCEENAELVAAIGYALHAEYLLKLGVDYLVKQNEIVLVDNFTGRVSDKRRWPDGLHDAVETKENIVNQQSGSILNTISLQHLLKLCHKLAGMSATCESSAEEFDELYGLEIVVIPPHHPSSRIHHPDRIFRSQGEKLAAIVDEIISAHKTRRPILVGTGSVNESKLLARKLGKQQLTVDILNAENDEDEAKVVAQAGRLDAITISTNMAGRGTDIRLGDNPLEHTQVKSLGGLYVIGTQRNESPRIDRQLCGRAGRQGDPGESVFFTCLSDPLFEQFNLSSLLGAKHRYKIGSSESSELTLSLLQKKSNQVQRIIDGQNHQIRKTLTQYSHMIEQQRLLVWSRRLNILQNCEALAFFASRAAKHHGVLSAQVAEKELKEVCTTLWLWCLDKHWQAHLGNAEDLQESVRLHTLGGEQPLFVFQKQVTHLFATFFAAVEEEAVNTFLALECRNGQINLEEVGVSAPSSTWTYQTNDGFFDDFRDQMLAQPGLGGLGVATVWPLLLIFLWVKKMLRKQ